jgi:hypothetical protein
MPAERDDSGAFVLLLSPYFILLTSLKKNYGDSSLIHGPVQVYRQNYSPYISKEFTICYMTGWGYGG